MPYSYSAFHNFISNLWFLSVRQDLSQYTEFTVQCFSFWVITVPNVDNLLLLSQCTLIPCVIQPFFIFPMSYIKRQRYLTSGLYLNS
jgi:hypothetical protein